MTLEEKATLSYYQEIADLNEKHGVTLVQHTQTKGIFVKKVLTVYDRTVFQYLKFHPVDNMPRIQEAIEDQNTLIVIEEYIPGSNLQEIMDREGLFSEEKVRDIAHQLCGILRQLHSAKPPIIHRDIKPSNIILTPEGVVKLLDMNAAKWYNEDSTSDTRLIGTKGYAAPEQYGFGSSSIQTDIYAVGVLMNVLLTGSIPGEKLAEGSLRPIIEKCTHLDPDQRYRNVDRLDAALIRTQEGAAKKQSIRDWRSNGPAWRKYLPPGFRTGTPWKMVVAILGYAVLLVLSFCFFFVEGVPLSTKIIECITMLLSGLLVILISANYLNVQKYLPIAWSDSPLVRTVGVILWDAVAVFLVFYLLGTILMNLTS